MVVAVSGGLDSMALLRSLAMLQRKFDWELNVAHVNHGLRERDSDRDAELVKTEAQNLGLPFFQTRIDVRAAAKTSGESLEMAARRLRHAFLAQTAKSIGAAHVALAHHADDQAELLLLRLLRGTGSEGLGGMMLTSPSPAASDITLVRPFLDFTRDDLAKFVAKHRIHFHEDKTNGDLSIPRNQVRHHLIPLLVSRYNPSLAQALRRLAEIIGTEADFLRTEAARWRREGNSQKFASLHVALQRTILRLESWDKGDDADFDTIECRRKARISGKSGIHENSKAKPVAISDSAVRHVRIKLAGRARGTASFGGVLIRWKIKSRPLPFGSGIEQFDAAAVGPEIIVRQRRAGDRFHSLGMVKPGRLQNIFINRRIPVADRNNRLVFERASGGLVWVEGLPPGEDAKVTPKSRRILILELARSIGA